MELDNQERMLVERMLDEWEHSGRISKELKLELKKTIAVKKTAANVIARYFFIVAVSCMLLAFSSIFIDEKLIETIRRYFSLSNLTVALLTATLTIVWFWFVRRRRHHFSAFSYEVYMIVGGLGALTSLIYLWKNNTSPSHYTTLLLLSTLLLGVLSAGFRSSVLWFATLISFCGWYSAFSSWQSTDGMFLGMNYPLRFTVFGVLLLGLSLLQHRVRRLSFGQSTTYILAMSVCFTALWGLSVFGNYNNLEAWEQVRQTQVIGYAFVFGAAAGVSFYLGIRYKDDLARDFGLVFLLVNIYTRYFEYFWNTMHKGIFFLILAASFWLIGRRIEHLRKKAAAETTQEQATE
ncbi:hypothetical protein ACTHGU_03260 [Chitinophagaceae bacterium MMS25-I14]